jgi:hypothetical protein
MSAITPPGSPDEAAAEPTAASSTESSIETAAEHRERNRDRLQDVARRINRHRSVRIAARAGLAANGLVHMVIGAIAVGVALGFGGSADQNGALAAISATPGGAILLWFAVGGLWGLALWQLTDAAWITEPARRTRVTQRVVAAGKSIGFTAIGFVILIFDAGGSASGEDLADGLSERLLGTVTGSVILLALGITVGVVGGTSIFRGLSRRFREEVTGVRQRSVAIVVDVLGVLGYTARGIALVLVGLLTLAAIVFADADQVGGLDGALKYLASLPYGTALLLAVAVGFVAYGLYLVARSIHLPKEMDSGEI